MATRPRSGRARSNRSRSGVGVARPVVQHRGVGSRRSRGRTRPVRLGLGPRRCGTSTDQAPWLGDPGRPEEPAGQGRIVDRLRLAGWSARPGRDPLHGDLDRVEDADADARRPASPSRTRLAHAARAERDRAPARSAAPAPGGRASGRPRSASSPASIGRLPEAVDDPGAPRLAGQPGQDRALLDQGPERPDVDQPVPAQTPEVEEREHDQAGRQRAAGPASRARRGDGQDPSKKTAVSPSSSRVDRAACDRAKLARIARPRSDARRVQHRRDPGVAGRPSRQGRHRPEVRVAGPGIESGTPSGTARRSPGCPAELRSGAPARSAPRRRPIQTSRQDREPPRANARAAASRGQAIEPLARQERQGQRRWPGPPRRGPEEREAGSAIK